MIRVLILGAGGHGRVVADILHQIENSSGELTAIGYLDDDVNLINQEVGRLRVLGTVQDHLAKTAHDGLILAIGDNQARKSLYCQLEDSEQFVVACHPRAVVSPEAEVGRGSVVCAGVMVNPVARVGADVILNTGCTVDHHNQLADHCHIGPGAHLGGRVCVGEGSLVGLGAVILPNRRVGNWSTVGAGAVVVEDVPDHATVVGVPARVVLVA